MLQRLHISNFVLIDSLDIEFPDGLIIISGPTGAGKSILIGALNLLLGGKADASMISDGAENCVIEADFSLEDDALAAFCSDNDIDYDGGRLTVRRVLSRSGRSRSFVNDEPANLQVLEALGSHLVDIHSQHDTLLLTSRQFQLSVLDRYAGNRPLLDRCADLYSKVRTLDSEIASLEDAISRAEGESEYNRSLYEQLAKASLSDGELAALEEEQYTLAHSSQIKELLAAASEIFDPETSGKEGLNAALSSLSRTLQRLSEFLPDTAELAERIETARIEVKDIASEVEDRNSRMDCSPERLQQLDDRIALIYSLLKRHNVQTEAELISRRDSLKSLAFGCEALRESLEDKQNERRALAAELDSVAAELHTVRCAKAEEFSHRICEGLAFMELDRAVFKVSVEPAAMGPSGSDQVSFLFSATGTGTPAPVAKCASGGELSRIMLSLKQLMSEFMNMPTMVFDEIDTGVSGSVADRMGSVICTMGTTMQVFAITHLPQVAAKGGAHYLVQKSVDGDRTMSSIKKLSHDERVLELARMLSGSNLTPEAIANARSLLQ